MIMTNRAVWDKQGVSNPKNAKTCYDKFKGENILAVIRRGLVLSTIRKTI